MDQYRWINTVGSSDSFIVAQVGRRNKASITRQAEQAKRWTPVGLTSRKPKADLDREKQEKKVERCVLTKQISAQPSWRSAKKWESGGAGRNRYCRRKTIISPP